MHAPKVKIQKPKGELRRAQPRLECMGRKGRSVEKDEEWRGMEQDQAGVVLADTCMLHNFLVPGITSDSPVIAVPATASTPVTAPLAPTAPSMTSADATLNSSEATMH